MKQVALKGRYFLSINQKVKNMVYKLISTCAEQEKIILNVNVTNYYNCQYFLLNPIGPQK